MSSIMRCRSGLMALSVMRDAPVLMEVANPSSQDRTPRRAIVLAVPSAAAPYRASGLVHWHQTDMVGLADDVCSWRQSGPDHYAGRSPEMTDDKISRTTKIWNSGVALREL